MTKQFHAHKLNIDYIYMQYYMPLQPITEAEARMKTTPLVEAVSEAVVPRQVCHGTVVVG